MAPEAPMIELTHEQHEALAGGDTVVRADNETYVLVRQDVYDRMRRLLEEVDPSLYEYDDSPWTDEERDRLAEEAGEMLDRYTP
jgi:hypothetical protein